MAKLPFSAARNSMSRPLSSRVEAAPWYKATRPATRRVVTSQHVERRISSGQPLRLIRLPLLLWSFLTEVDSSNRCGCCRGVQLLPLMMSTLAPRSIKWRAQAFAASHQCNLLTPSRRRYSRASVDLSPSVPNQLPANGNTAPFAARCSCRRPTLPFVSRAFASAPRSKSSRTVSVCPSTVVA